MSHEHGIRRAFLRGFAAGFDAVGLAKSDPAFEGEKPGEQPPDGWSHEAAEAAGHVVRDDTDVPSAVLAGAWMAGYLEGWLYGSRTSCA